MTIRAYYYNSQLRKAAVVFANIFAGLTVRTGNNGCGDVDELVVPVRYGSTDRVASAIAASNTQNNLHTLPMMSCYLTGIELAPERQHGIGSLDKRTFLEQGGVYPGDVKVIERSMPIPYNLGFELSIYASNTDQAFQLLEQILIVFDYDLQVQFNDAPFDWTKVTKVILDSINNEENYPVGTDRRILVWSMTFTFETWLSPPMEIRKDLISRINMNISNMDGFTMEEYDDNGNLVPFESFGSTALTPPTGTTGADPATSAPLIDTGLYNASLDGECHIQPPAAP